ncbi:threonine synthase [Phenylobacterium haematophilum]|uniref:Threonine synthase n=1 Tax=Phenylobacterium haematophilum TaxID=98513 RepID=A0A839ZYP4_9CAUL|nr:threonine synthase [Phenylobacterium haematophilum]MBB3891268.1 threonine synthase [Phenylobacterium haematophilum]
MRYVSTRGQSPSVGFVDAVLAGLAPDGGLYVPQEWPSFTRDEISAFAGRPYAEVATAVLAKFVGDEIDRETLGEMCAEAYASFTHAAVVPVRQIAPGGFIAELFHGPSLAFKDVAMQLLARLSDHVLGQQKRTQTILCATSGDTGGAAVEAFRGRDNTKIVVMFPDGRISEVQRRFMTTAEEANVRCVAVDGDFDDCQAILKTSLSDASLKQSVGLSAVNSINFARIVAQSVYYFTSAVALGAPHRPVSFAVPSGNFGDGFAGYVAKRMGLPIDRIIVATNSNDILARAFEDGRYVRGVTAPTQSPAMDIQSASNFERLYFECVRRDGVETARAFAAFAETGGVDIPPQALAAMRETFRGVSVGEGDTTRTIVATLRETGEMIDPHTAVGVSGMQRARGSTTAPIVVLSTAHPAKFPETVEAATGETPVMPRTAAHLAGKPERFDRLPADAETIKAYVRAFAEG